MQDVHIVPGSKKANLSTEKESFLKVVCNENKGGSGGGIRVWHRSRIVAIDVLLSLNFAVVFKFNVFPFLASKAQFLGIVLINRQNASKYSPRFELVLFSV